MELGVYNAMRERLKNFNIVHSVIRNRECIYIFFENNRDLDDENAKVLFRAAFFYPKTERIWGYSGYGNFYKAKACVLPAPDNSLICVDFGGQVITQQGLMHNEGFEVEKEISFLRQVSTMRVRAIAGTAFVAGTLRTVFRREGKNQWTCLSGNDLAVREEEKKQKRDLGFNDIGGFALDDLYACGGKGDLCHYDGKQWTEIDLPTNQELMTLHCAPNGLVYIGGRDGLLIEGRGDNWQFIGRNTRGFTTDGSRETAGMGATIKDMAWYKDRLYLATDQGLYDYTDGRVRRTSGVNSIMPHPHEVEHVEPIANERVQELLRLAGAREEDVALTALPTQQNKGIIGPAALHSLSTDGNLLMLGGADKVVVFDGETWRMLYAPYGIDIGGNL